MAFATSINQAVRSLVNIGIRHTLSDVEKRRVRIINFISLVGCTIFLLFLIVFAIISNFLAWFPNLIGLPISSFGLWLNYAGRYRAGKYYILSLMPVVIVALAFVHGERVGVEHYLFFSSVFATALFDDFKTIFFFFVLNILSFGICEFIYIYHSPIYQDETWVYAYFMTVICSFSLLLSLFFFFKNDILLYVKEKEKKNIELEYANKKLKDSENELKHINETKSKILSIISHDLKNPMSIIFSLSHMLFDNFYVLDEKYKFTIVKTIKKTIDSSYDLINKLLFWSKSHSHGIKVLKQHIDISSEIDKVFDFCKSMADSMSITLESLIEKGTNVYADPFLLDIILRNLVTNAIKFSSERGVVTLKARDTPQYLEIGVSNSGVGISRENQKKLFQLDTDIRSIGSSEKKGTGLGLILCKEFIEASDGKIWVESEPEQETCFWFSIPKKTNPEAIAPSF